MLQGAHALNNDDQKREGNHESNDLERELDSLDAAFLSHCQHDDQIGNEEGDHCGQKDPKEHFNVRLLAISVQISRHVVEHILGHQLVLVGEDDLDHKTDRFVRARQDPQTFGTVEEREFLKPIVVPRLTVSNCVGWI